MDTGNSFLLICRTNRRKGTIESLNPPGLLLKLGIPEAQVFFRGQEGEISRGLKRRKLGANWREKLHFWKRNEGDLADLLKRAKREYLKKMMRIHPDISSNTEEEAVELNLTWSRLKYLYKQRGLS